MFLIAFKPLVNIRKASATEAKHGMAITFTMLTCFQMDLICCVQVRMNGGTNISVAIQKAGQLLKNHLGEDATRHVVLITDGRVDAYQSKEVCLSADSRLSLSGLV